MLLGGDNRGDQKLPRVSRWNWGGDHQVGFCGFGRRGFDTRSSFFLGFTAAGLVDAVDLFSGFLSSTLHRIPWILRYDWGKSRYNLSQGNRKALGWSASNAIRLVYLAIVGDSLDWTAVLCLTWLSLRRRLQPSVSEGICPVAVLEGPTLQLTLSLSSQSRLWCGRQRAEHTAPRVSACYVLTRGHE